MDVKRAPIQNAIRMQNVKKVRPPIKGCQAVVYSRLLDLQSGLPLDTGWYLAPVQYRVRGSIHILLPLIGCSKIRQTLGNLLPSRYIIRIL